jgi:hypothetical protein
VRWLEAQRAGDTEKAKAFVPPKGFVHEERLNGVAERKQRVTQADPIVFYMEPGALVCDERFDESGVAQCRGRDDAGDVGATLKKTKTGVVVTASWENEVEGC